MPESTADLVAQVRSEAELDVTEAVALGRLDAAHKLMVARSKCYRKTVSVDTTVADQADYVLPVELIEVRTVFVGGAEYRRARKNAVAAVRNAQAVFVGSGGVVAQGANESAERLLTLYPTPTVSDAGQDITAFGPARAPALSDSQGPVVPEEFFPGLVAGAVSEILRRQENRHDLADSWVMRFDGATEELRRQVRREWNTGPSMIEIAWPGA